MALEIAWTKRASNKFDKILEYLIIEYGSSVKKSFVRKVYDFLDLLEHFPEIGTIENKQKGIRGFVIIKQITVFYRIKNNQIILLDFFDTRQGSNKKSF
ncbi:MAG: type II toxin-antitoxin system RelE/ParE family toxin [Bacteroidales bacterium]|nr:type II toxin-antitoxin system RelE/ParE family toxin [Bacteroidales bacterium]